MLSTFITAIAIVLLIISLTHKSSNSIKKARTHSYDHGFRPILIAIDRDASPTFYRKLSVVPINFFTFLKS